MSSWPTRLSAGLTAAAALSISLAGSASGADTTAAGSRSERCFFVFLCPPDPAPSPVVSSPAPREPLPIGPQTPLAPVPPPAVPNPPVAVPPARPPTSAVTGQEPAELLRLINAHRTTHRLRPVTLDPELSAIAQVHTAAMVRADRLFHNEPLFSRESHRRLGIGTFGENVGFGYSVADNHEGFLASPYHHASVDGANYVLVGLAVARSADGRIWVTEDFGSARRGTTSVARVPRLSTVRLRTAPAARQPTRPTKTVAVAVPTQPVVSTPRRTPAVRSDAVPVVTEAPAIPRGRPDTAPRNHTAAPVTVATSRTLGSVPTAAAVAAALALGLHASTVRRRRRCR